MEKNKEISHKVQLFSILSRPPDGSFVFFRVRRRFLILQVVNIAFENKKKQKRELSIQAIRKSIASSAVVVSITFTRWLVRGFKAEFASYSMGI